ncbi:MAG: cytochrome c peroxidase, partial [Gemmatimonadales bacterium]
MTMTRRLTLAGGAVLGAAILAAAMPNGAASRTAPWTAAERSMLGSLQLASLGPVPRDPSNRVADNAAAAELGNRLFNDVRFSGNKKVSCATCHIPGKDFQDGIPLGKGVGTAGRRTMPVAGTAYSPWQFWDGRADSQWGQALGPLESAVEHGGDRVEYARVVRQQYQQEYESVFGRLPDLKGLPDRAGPVADSARARAWAMVAAARRNEVSTVYANIGKAIAAYERKITFTPTRFDRFVAVELTGARHTASDAFSDDERAGLRLFIGKANCVTCHNGPLLTDNHFHNTGVPRSSEGLAADSGRTTGVRSVMASEFN